MSQTFIITGASSGIGQALAQELIQIDCHLHLLARRKEKILAWIDAMSASSIKATFEVHAVDVSQAKQVHAFFDDLEQEGCRLQALINNAGFAAGVDHIQDAKYEDWMAMLQTNFMGAFVCAQRAIALMPEHIGARIINIGSIAGLQGYPGGGGYCASKFSLRALTQTLRLELLPKGIGVTSIDPGLVETNFSQVRLEDANKAKAVYQGLKPLVAQDIAEMILFVLSRPAHVNIDQIVTMPMAQASAFHVHRTS